ncbi:MAG: HAMP domain-containing sensor histidine kinase [Opitutus sp.]
MRLADFIFANTPAILAEWDVFAYSVWPDGHGSPKDVRDHAEAILKGSARDMQTAQTKAEQAAKSKGLDVVPSVELIAASEEHAKERASAGFELKTLMAEYRALSASVVRLWFESNPPPHKENLNDLTRFHEVMDQSLTQAVHRYTEHIAQSREMFLKILGHDVRTPLGAISVSAELLAQLRSEDPECTKLASQITSSTDAITRLLSDFLDFAGSRLGRPMPITRASMDLGALCREVVAEQGIHASTHTWNVETIGDLKGQWDPARLRQVLSNLLGNAVQHGADNSAIGVSINSDGARMTITVRNTGVPIPTQDLPRIFDPLVRGTNGKAREGSVGLGLYIVKEVVVAHGGTIDVESTEQGGTIFRVSLPQPLAAPNPGTRSDHG